MATRILALLLFGFFGLSAIGQITPRPNGGRNDDGIAEDQVTPPENDDKDSPWFIGGNFGAQFGSITFIDLSPAVGYRLTPRFRPGVGVTYQYWRQKDFTGAIWKRNIYGTRVFGSYQVLENVIGYGEYETLRINLGQDVWIYNWWMGAGYRQWISNNSAIDLLVLYNLNYEEGGIHQFFYGTPWNIKMGLVIGL